MTIDTSNWDKVTLGDIAQSLTIASKDPLSEGFERYVGLEHIEPGNIHIKSWGNVADGTTFTRVFRKGQVLFGKRRAYQKKAALAEFDGVCSGDILVCEAIKGAVLPELLPFIFQSDRFFEHAIKTSAGSLSPRTKFKDLAKFTFKLPTKSGNQERIADLLWSIDASICAWMGCLEMIDFVYKTLERKYLSDMFVPSKGRNVVKLEDVCKISGGSTPLKSNKEFWGGEICWLTPTEVTGRKAFFIDDTKEKITDFGLKSISNKIYPPGTVMMTSRASIGDFVINEIPMATNQGFTNFECSGRILNWYLLYSLRFNVPHIKRLASGSTFLEISKKNVKSLCIDLPDIGTQTKIVKELESVINKKNAIQSQIDMAGAISKGILNQIFG